MYIHVHYTYGEGKYSKYMNQNLDFLLIGLMKNLHEIVGVVESCDTLL